MKTLTSKWQQYQEQIDAPRNLVLKLTDGTNIWYLTNRPMVLSVGASYQILKSSISIKEGFDIQSRQWITPTVRLQVHNVPIKLLDTGVFQRPSDFLLGVRYQQAILYGSLGRDMVTISDMTVLFDGLIIDPPSISLDVIEINVQDYTFRQDRQLPQSIIYEAFTDGPPEHQLDVIPIAYGRFTAESDTLDSTGLMATVQTRINNPKFVVAGHACHAIEHAALKSQAFDDVSLFDSTTVNLNDSGYTTVVPVSGTVDDSAQMAWYYALITKLRPRDNYNGEYYIEAADADVTDLRLALDRNSATYAAVLDKTDAANIMTGVALFGWPDYTPGDTDGPYISQTTDWSVQILASFVDEGAYFGGVGYARARLYYCNNLGPMVGGADSTFASDTGHWHNDGMDTTFSITGGVMALENATGAGACYLESGWFGGYDGETFRYGMTAGRTYRVTYTASGLSGAGTIAFLDAATNISNSTHSVDITPPSDRTTLRIVADGAVHVHLDNITCVDMTYGGDGFVLLDDLTSETDKTLYTLPLGITVDPPDYFHRWYNWKLRSRSDPASDPVSVGDNWPLCVVVSLGTADTPGTPAPNGTALDQWLMRLYDIRLEICHGVSVINGLDVWAEGEGWSYVAWITGRSSNYAVTDCIEDPIGIIESLLRDELSVASANIDQPSFILAENTNVKARLNLYEGNKLKAYDIFKQLTEQSTFALYPSARGVWRAIALQDDTPTTGRTIIWSDIISNTLQIAGGSEIINKLIISSRWRHEYDEYRDIDIVEDATSQSDYDGTYPYQADWPNICGTSKDYVAAWLVNTTDGVWSKDHLAITLSLKGWKHLDLDCGDWIELDATSVDPHILCLGTSWSGRQFVITQITYKNDSIELTAVELYT